jgi:hypothetical protein
MKNVVSHDVLNFCVISRINLRQGECNGFVIHAHEVTVPLPSRPHRSLYHPRTRALAQDMPWVWGHFEQLSLNFAFKTRVGNHSRVAEICVATAQ